MAYSSIKRVLGETGLERKIRILFGLALLILIASTFLFVNRITEKQILDNTRAKASSEIENHLIRVHFKSIQLRADIPAQEKMIQNNFSEFIKAPTREGSDGNEQDPAVRVLVLSDAVKRWRVQPAVVPDQATIDRAIKELKEQLTQLVDAQSLLPPDVPADQSKKLELEVEKTKVEIRRYQEFEKARKLLPGVEDQFRPQQFAQDLARYRTVEFPPAIPVGPTNQMMPDQFLEDSKYVYYEPVIFTKNCLECHYVTTSDQAFNEAQAKVGSDMNQEGLQVIESTLRQAPVVFVRAKLPYQVAKQSINRSRAILLAVAIGTAFLSMLALYAIVRYVIVRPLKHLRSVADEVSHGRMDIRSELMTGDEFEELGRSFNKMLRHLLDAQKELQDANQDLDNKVDEQAQLNLKLHEMNKVKSEFLANMSHELRTPLNSIIGFSEILGSSTSIEGRERRYANNIHRSGRLLLDLINDILDLAKLEAGRMEVNPTTFQTQQLIQELCDIVRKLAEDKNIHLYAEVEPHLPDAFQDQIKIRQILINLLSNAIKFTPEGGRIRVSARREGDDVLVLEVDDTGIGIPEADRNVIFEKFRQGPAAIGGNALTREVAGTGLGLSIVRELCILLGGSIGVTSEVGKGSTFTVRLPWNASTIRKSTTEVSKALEEITKVSKIDFGRASQTPLPSQEEIADMELNDPQPAAPSTQSDREQPLNP